jgi:hypothetical protein
MLFVCGKIYKWSMRVQMLIGMSDKVNCTFLFNYNDFIKFLRYIIS